MSKSRKYFFIFLTVLLFILTIISSWRERPSSDRSSPQSSAEQLSSLLEIKMFSGQAKLMVGGTRFLESHGSALAKSTDELRLVKELVNSAIRTALTTSSPFDIPGANYDARSLLLRKLIIARYFGFEDTIVDIQKKLGSFGAEEGEALFSKTSALSPNEKQLAVKHWDWFGRVLALELESDAGEKTQLEKAVYRSADQTFIKFLVALATVSTLAVISFLSAAVLGIQLVRGKLLFRFQQRGSATDYCLEVFCLYLLGMLIASTSLYFAVSHHWHVNVLLINVIGILSLSLLILYPTLFGIPFPDVRKVFGLGQITWPSLTGNLFFAIVTYLASWTVIAIVIIPYAVILQLCGVDLNQGAHPIVPLLLGASDDKTLVLIVLLGVLIAPIVEEIMFRGALYTWLRSHFGRGLSIFVSALVFATVHPQGLIGIVPLTLIGMMLAFLREWRESLIAPILAHACVNGGTFLLLFVFFR